MNPTEAVSMAARCKGGYALPKLMVMYWPGGRRASFAEDPVAVSTLRGHKGFVDPKTCGVKHGEADMTWHMTVVSILLECK